MKWEKINIYDVCNIYKENINQYVPDHTTPAGYHYLEIKGNGKCKSYDLFSYNCVQASMDILLKGTFYGHYEKQRNIIIKNRKGCVPNYIYNKLKKQANVKRCFYELCFYVCYDLLFIFSHFYCY